MIALSPALTAEQKAVYSSWGPANTIRATTTNGEEHAARDPAGVWVGPDKE